jgi:hypothetical protein
MTGTKGIYFLRSTDTAVGSHSRLLGGHGQLFSGVVRWAGLYVLLHVAGAFQYEMQRAALVV